MAGKPEQLSVSEKLNDFIQKNRKIMAICLVGVIAAIIILVASITIRNQLQSKALSSVDDFENRYQVIRPIIMAEDAGAADGNEELWTLQDDLAVFQKKNSGYAAARAFALSAAIYQDRKNWQDAETAWINAAKSAEKTYFAPIAYFNAAVAAEEQGSSARALDLYNKSLEYGTSFPAAARAQFSIARIQETMGDKTAALVSYQILISKWPQDQIWANLAHSRILALTIRDN